MKKILLLFAITALILTGCFDSNTNHNSNPIATTQLNPLATNQPNPYPTTQSNSDSLNKIFFKNNVNTSVKGLSFTIFKTIDGEKGGEVLLNQIKDNIHAFAKLNIQKNSFIGLVNISITIDPSTASIKFSPTMSFKRCLILDASIKGLDLKAMNLNSKKVGFYYFPQKGSKVYVKNHGVSADLTLRKLSVTAAVLKHFSRYGWAK